MPATARWKLQPGSPKRSPSSSATGRAPMATMSRRIPPTPVAAPWNGSTAEGWLWLSTLNASASPAPPRRPDRRQGADGADPPERAGRGVPDAPVVGVEEREQHVHELGVA